MPSCDRFTEFSDSYQFRVSASLIQRHHRVAGYAKELVAGRLLWKRWARRNAAGKPAAKSGDCGDCAAAGPPPKEGTVHFYRRQKAEAPRERGADDET